MPVECTITHGSFPIVETRRSTETGPAQYDLGQLVYYMEEEGIGPNPADYWPVGAAMYVDRTTSEDLGGGLLKVTADFIGLLRAGEKRLRRVSAFGQEVSVGPVTYESTDIVGIDTDGDGLPDESARELVEALRTIQTPSGQGDRWLISDPILGVIDTYFTTSLPDTTVIGTAMSPVNPPPNPSYIWGSYLDPMRANHPNGWVLDGRDYENVYGNLCLVTDTFAYKQAALPD